jgi:hypothetical protein
MAIPEWVRSGRRRPSCQPAATLVRYRGETHRWPDLSKRADSVGTEDAFIVPDKVNALAGASRDMDSSCHDQPVAKLSDSPEKNMCDDVAYLACLRQVFEIRG